MLYSTMFIKFLVYKPFSKFTMIACSVVKLISFISYCHLVYYSTVPWNVQCCLILFNFTSLMIETINTCYHLLFADCFKKSLHWASFKKRRETNGRIHYYSMNAKIVAVLLTLFLVFMK